MSTNPPKAPFNHYPASLGGKGMGEKVQEHDLIWLDSKKRWSRCPWFYFEPQHYYTRPINPGPEHELVGEDVVPRCSINNPEAQFTLDGTTWMNFLNGEKLTVKQIIERNERDQEVKGTILAIRRRKVVKEQTGDKSILGKEGDEKCRMTKTVDANSASQHECASPAPGETKGASLPQMPLICAKQPEKYLAEQFPATEGHLPLVEWFSLIRTQFAPQPKTQQEKDEEWFDREFPPVLFKSASERGMVRCAVNTALAYARGEKVKE